MKLVHTYTTRTCISLQRFHLKLQFTRSYVSGGKSGDSTSNDAKPPRLHYESDWMKSFNIWYNEICNYDDGDKIAQDNFLKYVLPWYHSKELVETSRQNIRAFNVQTTLSKYKEQNTTDKDQWYLNEIRVEKGNPEAVDVQHLVLLHGYGASSGWFYKNFQGIIENSSKVNNLSIHGLDMIGFGLSGRPYVRFKHDLDTSGSLNIKTEGIKWGKFSTCSKCGGHLDGKKSKELHWCDCSAEEEDLRKGTEEGKARIIVSKSDIVDYLNNHQELIDEVEDVYIETLEQWRIENGIEKFDLVAHSLGGYLGMAYCLKHPDRVNKIVMVSPGGVERSPFAITNPEYQEIYKKNDRNGEIVIPVSNHVQDYGFLGRYGFITKTFRDLWNMRFSVLTFLRWLGPFGPKFLIDRNADKLTRSGNIQDINEIDLFLKYIYSCSVRASFSETSITRLFDATVVGKTPILDKLEKFGDRLKDKNMLWVYGEHDFMYKECGVESIKVMEKHLKGQSEETQGTQRMTLINNAGHNMYLDNSAAFNKAIVEFFRY
ncbi:hypothetical protein CANINC_001505 [Pichia inconspicua]|uniref:AB hydrolase-1 domain-containing protein n=1 Tax=Pichia inconspicua TaxID=52247 RepID=A0A4T0X435_9ASCO|nr:hypothetical protein CANINC_001505 [[Candida] inconspicua]